MNARRPAEVEWQVIDDLRPLAAATKRPAFVADPSDVATFATDGVVRIPGAFTDWVEPLRAGLDRNLADPEAYAFPGESTAVEDRGRFFNSYCNWQLIPEYLSFVLASEAAAMAAAFMASSTAQLFHEHAFSKEPSTAKATPWHHDLPYYCVDGQQTVSIYIPLDDTPEETAVRFLKGSHRSGQLHNPRLFVDGSHYDTADAEFVPVPDIDPHTDGIFSSELSAGDALLFDFRTLHGTTDAPVVNRRRAFSTRWLGDDVTYLDRPGDTSPPLHNLGLASGDRMREDWFPVLWDER